MRHLLNIFFLLLAAITAQAQMLFTGRVVDAETNEELPFVTISCANNKHTLSNTEGEFIIDLHAGDTLKLSLFGYETLKIAAKKNLQTIKMHPAVRHLREVQIEALDTRSILECVMQNLERDYKKNRKAQRSYFYRSLLKSEEDSYLIEAFMNAQSAVNLRNERILSGITGVNQEGEESSIPLRLSNIHNQTEIAPRTYKSVFWEQAIKPLSSSATLKKYYHTRIRAIDGNSGEKFYRIDFEWKKEMTAGLGNRRYMAGSMIVDAIDYRLLRFEGKIGNAFQWVQFSHLPSDITFLLVYDYRDGYAAVDHLSIDGGNDQLKYHTLVYCIHNNERLKGIRGINKKNTIEAVLEAGKDSSVWQQYEVIKRTREEDSALRRHPMQANSASPLDTVHSQNPVLQRILHNLMNGEKHHPQEKVFVHMDNNCYFQGDTIWFSAYARNTYTHQPSQISQVLYVELYTPDGFLVERKNILLKDGHGYGEFALNGPVMYSGFYELRAYTRWQLNWGTTVHHHGRNSILGENYYRDYEKIYSRVFPVYDKPSDGSIGSRNMTLRPMRRHFQTDPDKRTPQVKFYPEGGSLVDGVPCRVAFEALWSDGESMDGTLYINGDSVPTIHRGRGTFCITAQAGKTYAAHFSDCHRNTVECTLPEVQNEGVSISVNQMDSIWRFHILRSQGMNSVPLAFSIMNEGNLLVFRPLESDSTTFTFEKEKFLPGVNQITVFNNLGQILADRLFFVQGKDGSHPNIIGNSLKTEYGPGEEVDLRLAFSASNNRPGSVISVSVKDAEGSVASNDECNILTEMLLASEIKGFIPQPEWYFEQDDDSHRMALDLLMMTQGWRRYDWKQMAVDSLWIEKQPREKAPVLLGKIQKTNLEDSLQTGGNLSPELYIRCIAVRTDTGRAETNTGMIKVQEDGTFRIEYSNLQGTGTLFLDVMENKDREQNTFNRTDEYSIQIDHPHPRFVKPYCHYQDHLVAEYRQDPYPINISTDDIHEMEEVTVNGKSSGLRKFDDSKPAFILGSLEAENIVADSGIGLCRPTPYSLIVQALFGDLGLDYPYVHEIGPDGQTYLTDRRTRRFGLSPTRRVMEGLGHVPLDSIYSPKYLKSYSADFPFSLGERKEQEEACIEKYIIYTDYCPRREGSKRYSGTNLPEIIVVEYPYSDGSVVSVPAQRCLPLPGFAQPAEFYHPDYSKHKLPEGQKDYRRTLYWNPNLQLDENGEAHIQFYNNSRTSHLTIDAEGQASDGTLLWGR